MRDGGPAIDLLRAMPAAVEWDRVVRALPVAAVTGFARLVVVSPHPDDETLGAGGLIATCAAAGIPVAIVAVTDGEACVGADATTASIRVAEQEAAVAELTSADRLVLVRYHLPDGDVAAHRSQLAALLSDFARPGDLMVCPSGDDGHPDHAAVANAVDAVDVPVEVWWAPIWAWHSHEPQRSTINRGHRIRLDGAAHARKANALSRYPSQLAGPNPVVPVGLQRRLSSREEVFVPIARGRLVIGLDTAGAGRCQPMTPTVPPGEAHGARGDGAHAAT